LSIWWDNIPNLRGEKEKLEKQVTWNASSISYLDPRSGQWELEVQNIIHLQKIANEFPDAFTDTKRVTKSHISVLNTPAQIDIIPAEVTIQRKCGRPIGSKHKKSQNRKEQNNTVGVTPAEVTDKIPEEIVSKIPEEIGSRTPEEVVDKVQEETQAPNDYEISINYVHNGIIWNRNEIRVDEIFAYAIAIEVINEKYYVSKTPEECMHINDWPNWKDALKTELDSLEKRNVFGPIILTPKNINPVGYKWVFAIKKWEKWDCEI
jgi:hypothetical protein